MSNNVSVAPEAAPKKSWIYTLNNYSAEEWLQLKDLDCTYHIMGKEVGENGTPHIQGCITFKSACRLPALKKINDRVHWEWTKVLDAARNYCMKDKEYIIIDNRVGQGKRKDLDDACAAVKEGGIKKLITEQPGLFVKYHGGFMKYESLLMTARSEKPTVCWFYGFTGTGKTSWVYDKFGHDNIHPSTSNLKWWNGYIQQMVLLLDDFRSDQLGFASLLRLLDRYPYQVEVKGGFIHINSKYIIITTPLAPEETYELNGQDGGIEQLTRRIDCICSFYIDVGNNGQKTWRREVTKGELPDPFGDNDTVDLSDD